MKALRNSMSKPRLLLITLLIALQLLLVLSFVPVLTDQAVSGVGVLTIGAMEILLCLILFSILTGKFPTTATASSCCFSRTS